MPVDEHSRAGDLDVNRARGKEAHLHARCLAKALDDIGEIAGLGWLIG